MIYQRLTMKILVLAVLVVGAGAPAGAQSASFTLIPAANLTSISNWASGVTADGSIVTGIEDGVVFRYTSLGGTEYLSPPDWQHTFKAAVSADGSTILSNIDDGTGVFSAALYTDAGGWTSLGGLIPIPPAGGDELSTGYSLNHDGTAAVGLAWRETWRAEAFYWTEAGGMVGLGQPVGSNSSRASDISADGSTIVGFFENPVNGCRRPARWAPGGTVDLFLGEEICGEAIAVSTDGSVIVGSAIVPGADFQTAFLYTDSGGWVDLGKLGTNPYHEALATGISENGTIVGLSGNSAGGNWTGFVWTEAEGMRPTGDVLTGLGATIPSGLWLAETRDISADGTTMIGIALTTQGYTRAYVATIPVSEIFADGFEGGSTSGWSAVGGGS